MGHYGLYSVSFRFTNIKYAIFHWKSKQLMRFREARSNSYSIRRIYGTPRFAVQAKVQSFMCFSCLCGASAIILHFDDTENKK